MDIGRGWSLAGIGTSNHRREVGMREQQRRQGGGRLQSLLAFTFGAAVGTIAALLYAPAPGQVTRRRIAMRVKDLRRKAARRISQTQRVLASKAENVREAATEWLAERMPHTNGRHTIRRRVVRHATN